ncbi:MAG: cell division protein FtsZ [Tannerella sp.]|jgi:cell division protein FtsZ|nr:cell division protein FtsZ [Tannerella sp.]
MSEIIPFKLSTATSKIIKVIGVGGGGGNAVTHMYKEGIHDVSFVLCNTDEQALMHSDVPVKIVLGRTVTGGLGAGNDPEKARMAAEESEEEIYTMLNDGTKMVFITAGMGGGTGTGAAPVIAKIAKDMGILTIGIVTIPFLFEGRPKINQALNGVEEMNKNVDALLVINNERLSEIYHEDLNVTLSYAFAKADDTLAVAAKSIAEIITLPGVINLDFADVNTTMKNGGVALMSSGYGEGEDRLERAIDDALNSPLLNNNDIFDAKKLLFNISSSKISEIRIKEMAYIKDFTARFGDSYELIWGTAIDDTLGEKIKFTVLATGFGLDNIPEIKQKHTHEMGRMTDEDIRRADDIRRKAQEDDARIKLYYGEGTVKKPVHSVSRANIVILTVEESDDDRIISFLEDHPTYNRDPKLISHARGACPGGSPDKESATQGNKTKISFKNNKSIIS